MAFGLLGSIIPQTNRNEVFYTSSSSILAFGKVSISNKNYNPAKIRLGITSDNINIEYLEYNRFVNYGETLETDLIYLGNGQKLVARSSDSNVNFLFYGETIDETANPVKSGLLGSVLSTNNQKKVLYSPPTDYSVLVTLSICNLDSQPAKARIGLSNGNIGSFDSTEYLEYDVEIGPNQTYTRSDIKISYPQTLICSSSDNSNINFVCCGRINLIGLGGEDDLNVSGNAIINGNLGVGTAFARARLDVIGNGIISNNLSVGGTFFGKINSSSLNQSLFDLGALPAMDGSALTNIIATGFGVEIRDDNSPVGSASTINFGNNLSATFSSGIATVAVSNNVNITNDFSVATNRFTVSGTNGNSSVLGTLDVGSSMQVSGNINTLNNKVINVGTATSSTDATNKGYVDTRSIAMSIALS